MMKTNLIMQQWDDVIECQDCVKNKTCNKFLHKKIRSCSNGIKRVTK
jgi:hypothetical protein